MGIRHLCQASPSLVLAASLSITAPGAPLPGQSGELPPELLRREASIRELYRTAESQMNRGDFDATLVSLRKVTELDAQHPLAYLGVVLVQERKGDLSGAESLLRRVATGTGPGLSYGIGVLRFLQGKNQESESFLRRALQGYTTLGHPSGIAASQTGLGNVFLATSRYREAATAYDAATKGVERLGDEKSLAEILSNQAGVEKEMGNSGAAMEQYRRALEIHRRLGDRDGLAAVRYNIGLTLRARGEVTKALESFQKALEINRELGDRSSEAKTINSVGLALLDQGRERAAEEAFRRSLELARGLQDRYAEADALTNLALVNARAGKNEEALRGHLEALSLRRETEDRAGQAESLNNAASVREEMGAKEEALRLYEESLQLHREIGNRSGEALLLTNLGRLYTDAWNPGKAILLLRQAFSLYHLIGNPSGEAVALREGGKTLMAMSDYAAAEQDLERSLRMFREIGDRGGQAESLDTLGVLYGRMAELDRARTLLQQALQIERSLGDRLAEAVTLSHLSGVHFSRGELAEALRLEKESVQIRRVLKDLRGEATGLNNLGAIYHSVGDPAAATRYVRDSLERSRSASDAPGEALARNNLGVLLEDAGDLTGAAKEYAESARLREGLGDRRGAAFSRQNLAGALRLQRKTSEARDSYRQALTAFRETRDPGGEALTLTGLGYLFLQERRLPQAAESFQAALRLARSSGMRDAVWRAEAGLAECLDGQGLWQDALEHIRRSISEIESMCGELGAEEFKSRYLAGKLDLYEKAVRLLWVHAKRSAGSDAADQSFQFSERAHARSLLDLLAESRADLRRGMDPALKKREALLLARISHLGSNLREARGDPRRPKLQRDLEEAEEDLDLLRVEMRRYAPRYAEIVYPTPASSSEIRSNLLRPGEALVEYQLGEKASYGWVLTRDSVDWWELPPRGVIETEVKALLETLKSEGADLGPEPAYRGLARDLGRLLLPSEMLKPDFRLILVPDGILHYLPFEALVVATGQRSKDKEAFILENHEVVYIPSASSLRYLRRLPPDAGLASARLLALGEIPQAAAVAGVYPAGPLPFAREEVVRIGGLFPADHRLLLLGAKANETALKTMDLRDFLYFHFAGHGWFDEEAPWRSGILVAPAGGEDGLLQMNEIFTLRTGPCLVVLSACQSGFGRFVRGEGIVGLTRAFLYAGARGVVVSLWNVNDRSTAELMEAFYREMGAGARPSSALRRAKLTLLRSALAAHRHPSSWAPFVLVGDPGPAPSSVSPGKAKLNSR
jgi:tetratricopeptide (TPR) repeat protein